MCSSKMTITLNKAVWLFLSSVTTTTFRKYFDHHASASKMAKRVTLQDVVDFVTALYDKEYFESKSVFSES